MVLEQGVSYRASLALSGFARLVGNATVAEKFRDVGFVDVTVTGSGAARQATGTWPLATREVELPEQVTSVDRVGPSA